MFQLLQRTRRLKYLILLVLHKDEKRLAIKKAKEDLEEWLQNNPKVRSTMRYSKAEILFADEPIWKIVHEGERKEIFADALVSITNCYHTA